MTVRKLIKKYTELVKQNYETMIISQVINDLNFIVWEQKCRRFERKRK